MASRSRKREEHHRLPLHTPGPVSRHQESSDRGTVAVAGAPKMARRVQTSREKVIAALRKGYGMSPIEVVKATGLEHDNVRQLSGALIRSPHPRVRAVRAAPLS